MNAGAIRDDNRSIPKAEPARPRLVGGSELLREPTQAPADAVPLMYPLPRPRAPASIANAHRPIFPCELSLAGCQSLGKPVQL